MVQCGEIKSHDFAKAVDEAVDDQAVDDEAVDDKADVDDEGDEGVDKCTLLPRNIQMYRTFICAIRLLNSET